jgi:hypothetical protein
VGAAEIRHAIAPLGWDELIAVRALLADPPPARPLGPHALVDLARGVPPDLAAEREREGRYSSEGREDGEASPVPPSASRRAAAPPSPATRRRGARGRGVVIRRARDAPATPPPAPPAPPSLDELLRPEGRATLERLVRTHGGRRSSLVAALAAAWRRPDGGAPREEDLDALLDHHGLARAYERRERDEVLHALRAEGGVRTAAAARLGVDVPALDAALARLDAGAEAERIREARRADLRARATLAARVRLLLADEPRLRDLDLLPEFEEDLRVRLPEHLRALRGAGAPVATALARSLSLTPPEARALAARFGLDVGPAERPPSPRRGPPSARRRAPARARRTKPRGPAR